MFYINFHNRPPHFFINSQYYFITGRSIKGIHYLDSSKRKNIFLAVLNKSIEKFSVRLHGWVLLNNHYHLIIWVENAQCLPKFISNLHSNSSRILNKYDRTLGRRIWWNYWDHCIRNERDYYTHLNYIHHNPVKHGLVGRMEDYPFSSYREFIQRNGREWVDYCFYTYPIIDFTNKN